MASKVWLIIVMVVLTAVEAFGQYLLALHHRGGAGFMGLPVRVLPILTWILYGVCTYILLYSYSFTTMGKAEVYWDAMSALMVPVIGFIYFNENINTVGWSGIALIIFGTLILGEEERIFSWITGKKN